MTTPLAGQGALVTGASRGIGRAIAARLAREGAAVAVGYATQAAAAEETVQAITAAGGSAFAVGFDVGSADAVAEGMEAAVAKLGRLDVLVNNAGVSVDGLVLRYKEADWQRVLAVNLTGVFLCTKAALRTMVRARYGRIVSVTSVVAQMGNAGQAAYAASKAGVIGMVRAWAPRFAERHATINAVAPGFIVTEMTAKMPFGTREIGSRINSLQQGGLPVDVAETIAWLSQPGSAGVNGQTVRVCGQSMLGA